MKIVRPWAYEGDNWEVILNDEPFTREEPATIRDRLVWILRYINARFGHPIPPISSIGYEIVDRDEIEPVSPEDFIRGTTRQTQNPEPTEHGQEHSAQDENRSHM